MLQLSEEINQQLEIMIPLLVFFGLPEKDQIAFLPVLEERKYDFPEGDLVTAHALEVLMNGYKTCLNSILIQLLIMPGDFVNKDIEDLVELVEKLLETACRISEEYFKIDDRANPLETSDWQIFRQLSLAIQQMLGIQLTVNSKIIRNCVEYWLHP